MRILSRSKVEIAVALLLLASVSITPARADDLAGGVKPATAARKAPSRPKRARRAETRKVGGTSAKANANSLIGPSGASRQRDAESPRPPSTGSDAWTVSPKWSASNTGNSAPYGTRALMNELQANPAETTGYGAGAEVNFHF